MGCLGGFEVLGLIGLVIGPVVLTLARELWEQRVRDLAVADVTDSKSRGEPERVTTYGRVAPRTRSMSVAAVHTSYVVTGHFDRPC